jgi:hypothetical protein
MLTENHIKEGLSRAFILAVAHRAGFNCSLREFDYGIDGTFHDVKIRDGRRVESGFSIDFQAKASEGCIVEAEEVIYDLEAKNHRDLAEPAGTARILIVLALPPDPDEWLRISPDALIMKRCAWWISLRGRPPTTNRDTQRIRISRTSTLDVCSLTEMMRRVKAGGLP